MNHKQIWTEIAKAFLTPKEEATKRQSHLTVNGLCWAAECAAGGAYRNEVDSFICSLKFKDGRKEFWFDVRGLGPHRREYDLIRGDFATLMACMTEKEFHQLVASD